MSERSDDALARDPDNYVLFTQARQEALRAEHLVLLTGQLYHQLDLVRDGLSGVQLARRTVAARDAFEDAMQTIRPLTGRRRELPIELVCDFCGDPECVNLIPEYLKLGLAAPTGVQPHLKES